MIFYRCIILFSVLLFYSGSSKAQGDNYVYRDSVLLYQDSLQTPNQGTIDGKAGTIYSDEEFTENGTDTLLLNNQLSVERDSIRALKNSKSFAYAKNLDTLLYKYQQSMAKENIDAKKNISWLARLLLSPFTKYFFWLVAVVFVSFILYKLFFAEGFFQRRYARLNVTVLPGEKENLSMDADYEKLIAHAVVNRNFRLGIRYHYLQTLKKLSTKRAIQFAADKTNYQYVRELAGKPYKNSFASLTVDYEYVWYGEFEVDETIFSAIQDKFKRFNSEV